MSAAGLFSLTDLSTAIGKFELNSLSSSLTVFRLKNSADGWWWGEKWGHQVAQQQQHLT